MKRMINKMIGSAFLGVSWLVIIAIAIIASIWIFKSDKRKRNAALTEVKQKWERGEITEEEYNRLAKKIWEG
jgi:uncharacterized membrane protein